MLRNLPRLTSLSCEYLFVDTSDLLAIASHSTLEQLHLEARGEYLGDEQWLGHNLRIPAIVTRDKRGAKRSATARLGDVKDTEQTGVAGVECAE